MSNLRDAVSLDEREQLIVGGVSTSVWDHYLTHGLYVPRHYEYLDTLYNIYVQIWFYSRNVIPSTGVNAGRFVSKNYRQLCELVNGLINNRRMKSNSILNAGYSKLWAGKEGVIRQSVLAKRTVNCARSVIVPDPTLAVDQIRLPLMFRERLAVRFVWDVEHLFAVTIDPNAFDDITHIGDGDGDGDGRGRIRIRRWLIANKASIDQIPIGTTVYRRLRVGDQVMVNRQPTLRLQNILGLYVGSFGEPWDHTIGINLALTTGFGADFDGDEMNIWVPQTAAGRRDLDGPLSVSNNRTDEATGTAMIKHSQDVRLGYFLRHKSRIPDNLTLSEIFNHQLAAYEMTTSVGQSLSLTELYVASTQGAAETAETADVPTLDGYVSNGWRTIVDYAKSKGSMRNFNQITGSVGIQYVRDSPVPSVRCVGSGSGGIITGGYLRGLRLGEYVQHCMAARESLISTAILTGKSGYRGRLLNLSMADAATSSVTSSVTSSAAATSTAATSTRPNHRWPGLRAGIFLGQCLTQEQLSSFHQTGQNRICSTLNDTIAFITGRIGGPAMNRICTWNDEPLYSFSAVDGVVEYGIRLGPDSATAATATTATTATATISTPVHVLEAYFIWYFKKYDRVCEIEYYFRFHDKPVMTEFGQAEFVSGDLESVKIRLCETDEIVDSGKRTVLARKILSTMTVVFVADDEFIAWFRRATPGLLLKLLYGGYDPTVVVCSDARLCAATAAMPTTMPITMPAMEAMSPSESPSPSPSPAESESMPRATVRFFLERSPLRVAKKEHIDALLDNLFIDGKYSSITRFGDSYRRKTTIGRASIESGYTQIRDTLYKEAVVEEPIDGCFSSELWMMGIRPSYG
jgi:hypothetical protein